MRTLEDPVEIEVHEGWAAATPRLPNRIPQSPRRRARGPRLRAAGRAADAPALADFDSAEALQYAGALPAGIVIE
jgi:hypothetical protein